MIEWVHDFDHDADDGVLVSLDPGKRASGYAIWVDRELAACGLAKQAGDLLYHWASYPDRACFGRSWPGAAIMEMPKIYDRRRWKGNPNDLIPISAAGALMLGALRPNVFAVVIPEDWKGQVPKEVQNNRDRKALSAAELAVLDSAPVAASKLHNVIDAIGIGLWALKRQLR